MNKFFAVTKYELIRYFTSPLAYVYLLSFLVLNSSFAFYFGDFFNRGQADLLPMFDFQPWLYLLFIPGIATRLWSEEFRQKTIMQIITMPVSITTLVIGKFTAAWLFCGLALFLTFPFWLTANLLGQPDNMVILIGYIASFALAGCMLALSEMISAVTKNQVIALVIAVIANLCFFWSGIEYILAFFRFWLPVSAVDAIASFSFLSHFGTLCRGVVELRDIIFFVSFIVFCLGTTVLVVLFKTSGTSGWFKSNSKAYVICTWMMLLLAFFGINILANNFTRNIQFDATQEKLFTLTDSTKTVLKNLHEPVLAKLYFSPILAQRNAQLRMKFDNLRLLLQKYKSYSNHKFDYKIYYPQFLSKEEDIALADGIQPVPLIDLNQNALFGLTLEDDLQNKNVIPFFAQDSQGSLEQDITTKLYQLHHHKKSVGIIGGDTLFGILGDENSMLRQPWQIVNLLEENYRIYPLRNAEDLQKFSPDVLLIFFPYQFDSAMIEQIKKYSQNGGKAVVFLDSANESSRLYAFNQGPLRSSDSVTLEELWKFKFYNDYVVADLENAITVDATIDYKQNPVFSQDVIQFKIPRHNMNPFHPITQNLREMLFSSASIVMPDYQALGNHEIKFIPLLTAGKISAVMTSGVVLDGLNPQKILQYFNPDDNPKILAAEIKGTGNEGNFDVIVVGDTDMLYDTFWVEKRRFLESEYVANIFDNANFVLNAIDYLIGNTTLLKLRGKRAYDRKFQRIETLRRINSLEYKKQEENIFAAINQSKLAIQEIWNKRNFEERNNFSADELAALSSIRNNLRNYLQQLSDLRYQAYQDIARIAQKITFFNIWLLPLCFALFILVKKLLRISQIVRGINSFRIDRQFLVIGGISLLLLLAGILSVYYVNYSSVDGFENKKAFPAVQKNINQINHITLRNHRTQLTFTRDLGLWKLTERPDVPVYQERIRRLLTTVAEATFFSKKSDKAENLSVFNLLPIEDKNSQAIQLTFQNNDKVVQTFNLGNINLDLGRSEKAAYMRFPEQFQVWEIIADFVDMDLDWHKWTYAHVWDLRYGRLYDVKGDEISENRLANLMKVMLNTPILDVVDSPNVLPIKKEKLYVEDGNYVDLELYQVDGKSYVGYRFDKNNGNPHLKTSAQYFKNRVLLIDNNLMEKIFEFIN